MLTRQHSIEGRTGFGNSAGLFDALDPEVAKRLALVAGDVTLILDDTGTILDASAHRVEFPETGTWVGRNWIDTVTAESRPKIMEMLAAARKGQTQHWRQVNHSTQNGDVAVKYTLVPGGATGLHIALGRDLREAAVLQQRLLQAQQSLERDYLRMRRVEAQYRLLFELSSEAVIIVAADGHRIKEANPAAYRVLNAKARALDGARLPGLFAKAQRDRLIGYLGAALTASAVSPLTIALDDETTRVRLSATGFRQRGLQLLMLRVNALEPGQAAESNVALEAIEQMPDAFVLTDAQKAIVSANVAFVEMVEAASLDQIRGRSLGEFVGRPGIDLELIDGQVSKHGFARNVATIVGGRGDQPGEPVELSAVVTGGATPHYAFVLRHVGRRLSSMPRVEHDLPRSVEHLTELVGRMSLKDIVRESTDLIERLCIEAALSYTADNRASAAEILGLSRQSLYSKLHRYGLGNLVPETD